MDTRESHTRLTAPLARRSRRQRVRAVWIVLAITLALLAVLGTQDAVMRDAGGLGIIPFEVARTTSRAQEILDQWGERGQAAARRSLAIDFVFIAAYVSFLVLACGLSGERLARGRLASLSTGR